MKCNDVREILPDLAAGFSAASPQIDEHIRACSECGPAFSEIRRTIALLDQWEAPEPSPYFDTRLRARLREEAQKPSAWFGWLRKPALAFSLAAVLMLGISLFRGDGLRYESTSPVAAMPGTAVSDLQALDKNHDLYSDFDVLDDLEVQQNVAANP